MREFYNFLKCQLMGRSCHDPKCHIGTCLSDVLAFKIELLWVIIVDDLEGLAAIGKVTRVDADLFKGFCYCHRHLRLEVDVRHKRHIIPAAYFRHLTRRSHARDTVFARGTKRLCQA